MNRERRVKAVCRSNEGEGVFVCHISEKHFMYFDSKQVKIFWLQLLNCERLLVSFLLGDSKLKIFGFWKKNWSDFDIFCRLTCWSVTWVNHMQLHSLLFLCVFIPSRLSLLFPLPLPSSCQAFPDVCLLTCESSQTGRLNKLTWRFLNCVFVYPKSRFLSSIFLSSPSLLLSCVEVDSASSPSLRLLPSVSPQVLPPVPFLSPPWQYQRSRPYRARPKPSIPSHLARKSESHLKPDPPSPTQSPPPPPPPHLPRPHLPPHRDHLGWTVYQTLD